MRRWLTLIGAAAAVLGCSNGEDSDGGDGSAGESSGAVLDLVQRSNDITIEGYDLYCAKCSCGAIQDPSDAAERCFADVISEFADIKDVMLDALTCTIDVKENQQRCLSDAADCTASEACIGAADMALAECEQLTANFAERVEALSAEVQERCGDL